MEKKCKIAIFTIVYVVVYYGINLLILASFFKLFDYKNDLWQYLIPFIVDIVIGLPQLFFRNFEEIFAVLNFIFGLWLGLAMYMFFFCIIYQIIEIWVDLKIIYGLIIILILPVLISAHGVFNCFTTTIHKEYLECELINSKFDGYEDKKVIMHISDLLLGTYFRKVFVQKIVDVANHFNPDVIVITGGLTDGFSKFKFEWLKPFEDLFNKKGIPTYFICGSQENFYGKNDILKEISSKIKGFNYIGQDQKMQEESNLKEQKKQKDHYFVEFCDMNFIGIDGDEEILEKFEYIKKNKENFPDGKLNILLSNKPFIKPKDLKSTNIFLFLCGHTRGGQLIPMQLPTYFFNKCFAGLYNTENDHHHIYVSSGIGASIIPMRVGSTSEIAIITIKEKKLINNSY